MNRSIQSFRQLPLNVEHSHRHIWTAMMPSCLPVAIRHFPLAHLQFFTLFLAYSSLQSSRFSAIRIHPSSYKYASISFLRHIHTVWIYRTQLPKISIAQIDYIRHTHTHTTTHSLTNLAATFHIRPNHIFILRNVHAEQPRKNEWWFTLVSWHQHYHHWSDKIRRVAKWDASGMPGKHTYQAATLDLLSVIVFTFFFSFRIHFIG